jgi:hypothetical protein
VQVEAVLSHDAIEALDERVLRRFSELDEVQLHLRFLGPEVRRSTSGTLIKDVTAASFDGQAAMAAH